MAEVIHRYVGRGEKFIPAPPREESESARERAKLDAEWRRKRISAEDAKQRLHEAKILAMKRELNPRQLVQKQATFLVLSMRARLLQVAEQHASELLNISDRLEMTKRLDAIMRSTLETLADMPLKVTDPEWMRKLDDVEQPAKRRIAK